MLTRVWNALGPIAFGLVLDSLDAITIGPLGIYTGGVIGYCVCYFLIRNTKLSKMAKQIISVLGGAYLMTPGTAVLPIATAAGVIARFYSKKK